MFSDLIYLSYFCMSIVGCYGLLHLGLKKSIEYNNLKYHKKLYVLKNITKSIFLFFLSIYTFNSLILSILIYGKWNNKIAHFFASGYVSNDLMGLLIVPKLPFSTKMHHIITSTLLFYSYTINFEEENVGRWMFLYTIMSTYTFTVNFYLGLRHIRTKGNSNINMLIDKIRVYSFYIYLVACVINWIIHIILILDKTLNSTLYLPYILYCFLLIPIINDDLILMSWLYNNVNN